MISQSCTMGGERLAQEHRRLSAPRLAMVVFVACLFVLSTSYPFQTYVMPHLDDEGLSPAERIRSGRFGDSYGYGRYAEGMLRYRRLRQVDGRAILQHMPGLPLLVAGSFGTCGSARSFLALQVLFLFASLYAFLVRVKGQAASA